MRPLRALMLAAGLWFGAGHTPSQGAPPLVIETVAVGNPGNPGDARFPELFGAVDRVYAIGKYEVTAGQYAAFLNAVAATDTYALYDPRMWTHAEGCRIARTGAPGSYTYSVASDWANRPVNFVSWGDAARFANWLHNGQPSGAQDLSTTEDGSYFLDGKDRDDLLELVMREADATWVIPTENEWYKAAYHRNDGVTGNYWNYPTTADNAVSNALIDPDPGNNATFRSFAGDFTLGPPYYRTVVGDHENSAGPYGTFDQGGNVQEFNETVPGWDLRGIRGGSWFWGDVLGVWYRPLDMHSSDQFSDLGFRVAAVAGMEVRNLRGFEAAATWFTWDPVPGRSGDVYDLARGDLASLTGNATAVSLGPLTCIENDSPDTTSQAQPDAAIPSLNTGFFYVIRFQEGTMVGPWGPGSEGQGRTGTGGCAP